MANHLEQEPAFDDPLVQSRWIRYCAEAARIESISARQRSRSTVRLCSRRRDALVISSLAYLGYVEFSCAGIEDESKFLKKASDSSSLQVISGTDSASSDEQQIF